MITAITIIILAAGQIILAVMVAWLAREHRRQTERAIGAEAAIDVLLVQQGLPTVFAQSYGMEVVDPTRPDQRSGE